MDNDITNDITNDTTNDITNDITNIKKMKIMIVYFNIHTFNADIKQ